MSSAVDEGPRPGGRPSGAPTIYDIARLADVDPSTVSRALNRPGRVNAKTVERIMAAAEQLRFRVNPIARALPTGRTRTLAVLVADITNPVVFGIIRGAAQEAAAHDYTLLIAESEESGEREATAARRLLHSADGLILATTRLDDAAIRALAREKPLVTINRDVGGAVVGVLPDLAAGVGAAVEHLVALGHRVIGYLPGPATSWISERRREAIEEAVRARDAEVVVFGHTAPTREGGAAAVDALVRSPATAVIGYNDLMMLGVLAAGAERGLDVPGDLSLIGFDDIFGSDFTTPPLTTVRMPLLEAGRRAVRTLLTSENTGELLPTELVLRASTGPRT
ncbi:LacI family DNA-binding transcriptional regulator [Nocardiopsis sediminis]|uniref:LacI family DNA-binding transcriptional regulator n=1 Tax=Nocardiopsis sediminis TaxID=1778267 RepID=A0ABV8FJF1_9ACTN